MVVYLDLISYLCFVLHHWPPLMTSPLRAEAENLAYTALACSLGAPNTWPGTHWAINNYCGFSYLRAGRDSKSVLFLKFPPHSYGYSNK